MSFVAHPVPEKIPVDKCFKSHLLGKCPAFSLHLSVGSVFHKVLGVVPGCLLHSQTPGHH